MKLERISIRNFRNIRNIHFNPDPHLNYFVGENAQGKTSILEAISLLSGLKSFRGAKPQEMISFENSENGSNLSCTVQQLHEETGSWTTHLNILLKGKKTLARVNEKPVRGAAAFVQKRFKTPRQGFHCITFNPADHALVAGEPALRRRYINQVIASECVEYLEQFTKYQRSLQQRNVLLKNEGNPGLIDTFGEQLVESGAFLIRERFQWLNKLTPRMNQVMRRIAPTQLEMAPFYISKTLRKMREFYSDSNELLRVSFSGQPHLPPLDIIKQTLRDRLFELREIELLAKTTLFGPHRDDWQFQLGNHSLKDSGSQGEIRSALLALKLSEIELFREVSGHAPVLLLDDFSSELDQQRRKFLEEYLLETDLQVFVTTTEAPSYKGRHFKITSGQLNFN